MKQATARFAGKDATRVIGLKSISDTSLLVTYSQPVSAAAALASNYLVTGKGAQPVQVTGAHFTDSTNTVVEVQTTPQSYGTYSFSASNVTDTAGQQVYFDGRKFTGNPKGAVLSVAATSYTRVVVAFNEPMADNALAPQHYSLKDPLGRPLLVTDAKFDGPLTMVVVLTTAAQSNLPYQLTVSNVTDLSDDGLTINTGSFKGIAAPTLTKAVATQANRLVLTFGGAVGDSALAPSSYKIEKLDDSWRRRRHAPDQRGRVRRRPADGRQLTTAVQSDAPYRISTTTTLTDVAGSPLPVVQMEFQGLGGQPKLVGATSTGPSTMLLTFSVPMSDDALSPSSYVINGRDRRGAAGPERAIRRDRAPDRRADHRPADEPDLHDRLDRRDGAAAARRSCRPPRRSTRSPALGRPASRPAVNGAPRVVGAASLSNTEVIVSFSEPMAANAIRPEYYFIVQQNVNPEAGVSPDHRGRMVRRDPTVVKLTTLSQNELTYQRHGRRRDRRRGQRAGRGSCGPNNPLVNPTRPSVPRHSAHGRRADLPPPSRTAMATACPTTSRCAAGW